MSWNSLLHVLLYTCTVVTVSIYVVVIGTTVMLLIATYGKKRFCHRCPLIWVIATILGLDVTSI